MINKISSAYKNIANFKMTICNPSFKQCSRSDIFEKKGRISNKGYSDMENIITEMESWIQQSSKNYNYPKEYKNLLLNKQFFFGEWELTSGKLFLEEETSRLQRIYNVQNLIPFATERNSNRLACFITDPEKAGEVVIINSFSPKERLFGERYKNINEWIADISQ